MVKRVLVFQASNELVTGLTTPVTSTRSRLFPRSQITLQPCSESMHLFWEVCHDLKTWGVRQRTVPPSGLVLVQEDVPLLMLCLLELSMGNSVGKGRTQLLCNGTREYVDHKGVASERG